MDDTVKYLIHADVTADGVVERSDVVGAIFGQTEGLLGDELDLRGLQQSSKVGRIDVDIDSENGQSFGHITIETSLDKVATATLAAALETISRVGPCRASVEVTRIEDVRAAKRREIVERATQLLMEGFSDSVTTSDEILAEVREQVRVENITEYGGLPAGPNVADSDAIVVVEGRADVLTLLQYGIKNAIAVEGTNVPEPVAELTTERTATVFLDGDRGGELILEELSQVGDIDYVAFAPPGQSVEDLSRGDAFEALQEKVPYDAVAGTETPQAATDGSTSPAPDADGSVEVGRPEPDDGGSSAVTVEEVRNADSADETAASEGSAGDRGEDPGATDRGDARPDAPRPDEPSPADPEVKEPPDGKSAIGDESAGDGDADDRRDDEIDGDSADDGDGAGSDDGSGTGVGSDDESASTPDTLRGHVRAVVEDGTGGLRLLDEEYGILDEIALEDAVEYLSEAETVPASIVVDGTLTQELLDVAAQRGVEQVVARDLGEFTKRPTSVRIRTAEQLTAS